MKTTESEKYFERAKNVSPGGVHSPVRGFRGVGGVPRFIESAKGAELFDVDGNRYIDYCMSWGPLIFGHQDPEVKEAVRSSLDRGWSYGAAEKISLELAELMTKEIPWLQKIRFVNSGTEAVMSALRLARGATGRNKILKFDGCYHGHVDSMLVRAGSGLAEMASPDSAGVSASVAADTLVAPLNNIETFKKIFELHGKEIAAVILEPVPANNGLLLQTEEFINELIKTAKSNGTLVIFDEVITGFRIGFGGMAEYLYKNQKNMWPDLVTYGKVIGGGFPVGAYGGRSDLMNQIAPSGAVYQAGTLSANPVAMTAGLAMLKKLQDRNIYSDLETKTKKLVSALSSTLNKVGVSGRIQNISSIFWCVLGETHEIVRSIEQIPTSQKERYAKGFHILLENGVYMAPSGFEVSFMSTAHSNEQLEKTIIAFEKSLKG